MYVFSIYFPPLFDWKIPNCTSKRKSRRITWLSKLICNMILIPWNDDAPGKELYAPCCSILLIEYKRRNRDWYLICIWRYIWSFIFRVKVKCRFLTFCSFVVLGLDFFRIWRGAKADVDSCTAKYTSTPNQHFSFQISTRVPLLWCVFFVSAIREKGFCIPISLESLFVRTSLSHINWIKKLLSFILQIQLRLVEKSPTTN